MTNQHTPTLNRLPVTRFRDRYTPSIPGCISALLAKITTRCLSVAALLCRVIRQHLNPSPRTVNRGINDHQFPPQHPRLLSRAAPIQAEEVRHQRPVQTHARADQRAVGDKRKTVHGITLLMQSGISQRVSSSKQLRGLGPMCLVCPTSGASGQ
jgi:hypothetical protein